MLGLTPLGTIHTAISLVALAAGIVAFARYGAISLRNTTGHLYVWTTVLTCLTGFGIFQHGGFGPPHILGIVTLVVLLVAAYAGRGTLGRASRYVETISYTLTYFFHMIPAFNETATRFPQGAPLSTGPDDPNLQTAVAIAFGVFLIGAIYQSVRLRASRFSAQAHALPLD